MAKHFLLALLVVLLLQFVYSDRSFQVKRDPVDWTIKERAPQDQLLDLIVGVVPRNTDLLEQTLFDVSSPRSKSYGKHLTQDQIRDLIRPEQQNLDKVYAWLAAASISPSQIQPNVYEDLLQIRLTVAEAEKLLNTKYFVFQHNSNPDFLVTRCLSYSLPEEIFEIVDTVGPSTRFPKPRSIKSRGPVSLLEVDTASTPQIITPALLRQLYQVGNVTNADSNNLQAVGSFLEQYYSPSDLALFFEKIVPEMSGQVPQVKGLNIASLPGIEASLDIQYIMGLGEFVNTIFWSTSGRQQGNIQNEPFLDFLYALGNDTNPPLVVSISYDDSEDSVEFSYAVRVNTEFQKAGLRGISVLTASGDGGVSGPQFTNNCTIFDPTFPAASPYVTAVGGTVGGFSGNPEIAANLTGGGFSNRWARPSYQAEFVDQYFQVAQNLPDPSLYNQTGAGFPDVSAQSIYFEVALKGAFILVDGTSCATPTVSSIISLLNGLRLNAGKASLGYLNNLFYENPQVFNDITYGFNPGCNTNGFSAAVGWDPLTGLGTPNFPALLNLVMSLP